MANYRKDDRFCTIFPQNQEYILKAGKYGEEPFFYIKYDGTTPFGSLEGNTFSSLKDTPNDLEKNVNRVLGSVGKKVGYINNPVFDNLSIDNDLEVKHLRVDGELDVDGLLKCANQLTAKNIKVNDVVQSLSIKTEDLSTKKAQVEGLVVQTINGEFVDASKISTKILNVEDIILPQQQVGSFVEPIMISKAEICDFSMSLNIMEIIATYPKNKPDVEFEVSTKTLLKNKVVAVEVNDLYGEVDIVQKSKMIKIIEPYKFKVVLNLNEHSGNSIIKILLSII